MNRRCILPIATLMLAAQACNLPAAIPATAVDPTLMGVYAGQTIAVIQTDAARMTQSAHGSEGSPLAATTQPPSSTPSATLAAAIPTAGATPTATVSIPPAPTATFTPSATLTLTPIPCNRAMFISDVNVPDNWVTTPGSTFTKIWRIQNIGTCTWTSSYLLAFDHGDAMGAPATKPLTAASVAPGQNVDISVDLVAPAAPGAYQGFYRLRAPDTSIIPFSNSPSDWFWLKIIAANPATPTFTSIPPGVLGVTTAFNQVAVGLDETGWTDAACPAGSIVVGGGFATGDGLVVKTQSKEANGWRVYGKNNSGGSRLLNSYAVCLSGTGGSVTQVFSQVTIAGSGSGQAVVSCPAGTVVTGGGYASTDTMRVYNSSMSGNGWQSWAENLQATSQLLNAYALCLSGTSASSTQGMASASIPARDIGYTYAGCPGGQFVTGGGFALQADLTVYNSSPFDSTTWSAYASSSSGAARTMFVYGVCLAFP